jgi:hypothetical protein
MQPLKRSNCFFSVAFLSKTLCPYRMANRSDHLRIFNFLLFLELLPCPALAHTPAQEMSDAANNFLAALDDNQKAKATYEFSNDERFDWHFIPKPRKGLPLKEMTPSQRALAHALLSSGLSHRGFAKATTIMSLEQILFDVEGKGTRPKSPTRDAELYYFTIFDQPGSDLWGWRVEGHHLSLNFVVNKQDVVAVTPSFMGSNPGKIMEGPRKGLRVLGAEEDLARDLLKSLSAEQRKAAIITNVAPRDIITGNSRKAKLLEPFGLCSTNLTGDQFAKLTKLIDEFVARYRPEIAQSLHREMGAVTSASFSPDGRSISVSTLDTQHSPVFFAWAGSTEPGQGHYYRIQTQRLLMEYDNTQNDANHIHTVVRDLANDFGDDILSRHYEQVPHTK